jgi:hypothetical protein
LQHEGNGKPYLQVEVFRQRFERIIFVAKTGTEGMARPSWFRYVCDEVAAAIAAGIGIEGICLYPIVNHRGGSTTGIATTVLVTTLTEGRA